MRRTLQFHGRIEQRSIFRSDTFARDWHAASFRVRAQLEFSTQIARSWTLLGLPIDRLEFFLQLRPSYEGIYDVNQERFGSGATNRLKSGPLRRRLRPGDRALLKIFGFDPRDFHLFGGRNFPLISPTDPDVPIDNFGRKCERCANTKLSENDLRFERTDFNSPWYPIREAYFELFFDWHGWNWVRLGKQQIVWGETDLFRLQDIVNPLDFSQHLFLESFEDIREPQWSLSWQHNFGTIGRVFEDVAARLIWHFERFQPAGLGQGGQPWATALGEQKRALAFLNGFLGELILPRDLNDGRAFSAALARENLPRYNLDSTGIGLRLEWRIGSLRAALTDYFAYRDQPVFALTRINVLEGAPGLRPGMGESAFSPIFGPMRIVRPGELRHRELGMPSNLWLERFGRSARVEIKYKKVNTLGLSLNWYEPHTRAVVRAEASWTRNALINDTATQLDWVTDNDIWKWALGADRHLLVPWLNRHRALFLSLQVFGLHFPGATSQPRRGIPNGRNNFTVTATVQSQYLRDQLITCTYATWSSQGRDGVAGSCFEWLITDHWSISAGVNAFYGHRQEHELGPFRFATTDLRPFSESMFGIVRESSGAHRDQMNELWTQVAYRW